MRLRHFEDVFLAGLLHDLGIVLEDQHVHGSFVETIQSARAGKTLVDVEQAHLGFDHTLLGEKVAQQWNLPNGVADAMRYHHDSAACQGNYWDTVQCVEVANYLCSAKKHSSIGMQLVKLPGRCGLAAFGMETDDLLVLAEDLEREFETHQTLFQL